MRCSDGESIISLILQIRFTSKPPPLRSGCRRTPKSVKETENISAHPSASSTHVVQVLMAQRVEYSVESGHVLQVLQDQHDIFHLFAGQVVPVRTRDHHCQLFLSVQQRLAREVVQAELHQRYDGHGDAESRASEVFLDFESRERQSQAQHNRIRADDSPDEVLGAADVLGDCGGFLDEADHPLPDDVVDVLVLFLVGITESFPGDERRVALVARVADGHEDRGQVRVEDEDADDHESQLKREVDGPEEQENRSGGPDHGSFDVDDGDEDVEHEVRLVNDGQTHE